jgi:hypothetical protein
LAQAIQVLLEQAAQKLEQDKVQVAPQLNLQELALAQQELVA